MVRPWTKILQNVTRICNSATTIKNCFYAQNVWGNYTKSAAAALRRTLFHGLSRGLTNQLMSPYDFQPRTFAIIKLHSLTHPLIRGISHGWYSSIYPGGFNNRVIGTSSHFNHSHNRHHCSSLTHYKFILSYCCGHILVAVYFFFPFLNFREEEAWFLWHFQRSCSEELGKLNPAVASHQLPVTSIASCQGQLSLEQVSLIHSARSQYPANFLINIYP